MASGAELLYSSSSSSSTLSSDSEASDSEVSVPAQTRTNRGTAGKAPTLRNLVVDEDDTMEIDTNDPNQVTRASSLDVDNAGDDLASSSVDAILSTSKHEAFLQVMASRAGPCRGYLDSTGNAIRCRLHPHFADLEAEATTDDRCLLCHPATFDRYTNDAIFQEEVLAHLQTLYVHNPRGFHTVLSRLPFHLRKRSSSSTIKFLNEEFDCR